MQMKEKSRRQGGRGGGLGDVKKELKLLRICKKRKKNETVGGWEGARPGRCQGGYELRIIYCENANKTSGAGVH